MTTAAVCDSARAPLGIGVPTPARPEGPPRPILLVRGQAARAAVFELRHLALLAFCELWKEGPTLMAVSCARGARGGARTRRERRQCQYRRSGGVCGLARSSYVSTHIGTTCRWRDRWRRCTPRASARGTASVPSSSPCGGRARASCDGSCGRGRRRRKSVKGVARAHEIIGCFRHASCVRGVRV